MTSCRLGEMSGGFVETGFLNRLGEMSVGLVKLVMITCTPREMSGEFGETSYDQL